MWCGTLYVGVQDAGKLSRAHAAGVVGGVWVALTVFQWAVSLYLTGVRA